MELRDYLIEKLSSEMMESSGIDNSLFKKYDVKRGLRNEDGTGVLVGLTNIGNVVGYQRNEDGTLTPIDGKLFLRGYEVADIVNAIEAAQNPAAAQTADNGDVNDPDDLPF